MKKVILLVAACAAMVACNNGKTTTNAESKDSTAQDSVAADSSVYEGMTPAAIRLARFSGSSIIFDIVFSVIILATIIT